MLSELWLFFTWAGPKTAYLFKGCLVVASIHRCSALALCDRSIRFLCSAGACVPLGPPIWASALELMLYEVSHSYKVLYLMRGSTSLDFIPFLNQPMRTDSCLHACGPCINLSHCRGVLVVRCKVKLLSPCCLPRHGRPNCAAIIRIAKLLVYIHVRAANDDACLFVNTCCSD